MVSFEGFMSVYTSEDDEKDDEQRSAERHR